MFQRNKGQWIYCLFVILYSILPQGGGGTDCVGLTEKWGAASSIFLAYDNSPQQYFGLWIFKVMLYNWFTPYGVSLFYPIFLHFKA